MNATEWAGPGSIGRDHASEYSAGLASKRTILSEASFAGQLCSERKRAERSGRKFALMLVESRPSTSRSKDMSASVGVLQAISDSMRETDVVGWHLRGTIAGAILTEFGTAEIRAALESIRHRVSAILHRILPPAEMEACRLTFHVFPEEWDLAGQRPAINPLLYPELPGLNGTHKLRRTLKRFVDIIGSIVALVALSPVLAAAAAAIRLTSRGPALYRQERIGQFGVLFTMYKFRSMEHRASSGIHEEYVHQFIRGGAASASNGGLFKLTDDPRVTQLGKLLRRTSLDELPQFFNVLRGEMSLVGPRPPLPYELRVYDTWHKRRVLEAKPGLTGLWQVNGRSKTQFSDMVRLDLRYARTQSVWLDLLLILRTVRVLLSDDGAC